MKDWQVEFLRCDGIEVVFENESHAIIKKDRYYQWFSYGGMPEDKNNWERSMEHLLGQMDRSDDTYAWCNGTGGLIKNLERMKLLGYFGGIGKTLDEFREFLK